MIGDLKDKYSQFFLDVVAAIIECHDIEDYQKSNNCFDHVLKKYNISAMNVNPF